MTRYSALPEILEAIERRNAEQVRDLAELREKLAAMAAEKAAIATRLGEAKRDLAETRAALEIEKDARQRVEMRNAQFEGAIADARAALDVTTMEPAPVVGIEDDTAPTTETSVSGNAVDYATPAILGAGQPDQAATDAGLRAMVEQMERRNEAQASDLAELVEKLAVMTGEREEIATRLDEAERGLAEVQTAIEMERQLRKEAEMRRSTLEEAVATARAALELVAVVAASVDQARITT